MKDLLKDLVDRIEKCVDCRGQGIDPYDEHSACRYCGGQGEVLDATPLIQDIREGLKKLFVANGIGRSADG